MIDLGHKPSLAPKQIIVPLEDGGVLLVTAVTGPISGKPCYRLHNDKLLRETKDLQDWAKKGLLFELEWL